MMPLRLLMPMPSALFIDAAFFFAAFFDDIFFAIFDAAAAFESPPLR